MRKKIRYDVETVENGFNVVDTATEILRSKDSRLNNGKWVHPVICTSVDEENAKEVALALNYYNTNKD